MKKVFNVIGKIIFYVFVVVVFLWTASLTLGEVKEILPTDPITPYFALALFDGGAVAWLLAWLTHARGIYQRAISIMLLIADLLGVILLSTGRLFSGGQTLAALPQGLGAVVIYGIVTATLLNLAALYAFHITDPQTMEDIEAGILEDTLRDEAIAQAQANIESEAQQLGAVLAARATGRLKYRLRLPMQDNEVKALDGETLPEIEQGPQIITQTQPAAQIIPAILATRPKAKRKPSPVAAWIVKAGNKARDLFKRNEAPQIVTYESNTHTPELKDQQPASLTPKDEPEKEPKDNPKSDENFT